MIFLKKGFARLLLLDENQSAWKKGLAYFPSNRFQDILATVKVKAAMYFQADIFAIGEKNALNENCCRH